MGANRERASVLFAAIQELPRRLPVLANRLFRGNPAMQSWLAKTQAAGRHPVFIVMIERLGDVIACTPIARQLKQSDPALAIAWVCSGRFAPALAENPDIDAVFHEESMAGWLLTKRLLDGSVIFHELFLDSQRCCWTGTRLPGRHSGITHENYLDPGTNLLLSYSRAAGLTGIRDVEPELFLRGTPPELPAEFRRRPLMVVHFDSEDPDRRLAEDAALRLVDRAIGKGWAVAEIGLRPIASRMDRRVYFPGASLPLTGHILMVKQAACFIGVDSAFLHCANAYRIPATLLLGKFRHFAAFQTFSGGFLLSQRCRILRGDVPISRIDPELPAALVPNAPPCPNEKEAADV